MAQENKTNFYLVSKQQYFIDPHGSYDDGAHEYFITVKEIYSLLTDTYYDHNSIDEIDNAELISMDEEEIGEMIEESRVADDASAEDGYNQTAYAYTTLKVGEQEAIRIQKVIDDYEGLSDLFNVKK